MGHQVIEFETAPERIRQIMESAGCTIGSVHFRKRKDNSLRKMSYRLHVKKPSVAPVPKGLNDEPALTAVPVNTPALTAEQVEPLPFDNQPTNPTQLNWRDRKHFDMKHNQITVLDVNKVVRDANGVIIGRGAWRTVPLNSVIQVTVKGKTYKVAGRD